MSSVLAALDLWKVFEWAHSRKAKNKAAVVEWLEAVYSDLEDLSKVWFEMCETLENANDEGRIREAQKILMRGSLGRYQWAYAGRLFEFYQSASSVLGNESKYATFHSHFVNDLAAVLNSRQTARLILDKKLPAAAISGTKDTEILAELRKQAELLQQEVVSLQVLIKTFKAQP